MPELFMEMQREKPATILIEDDAMDNDDYSTNRLFISNFPFSWMEKDLRAFLKDYEPVDEVEIVYNERGSKGFGFVTINDPDRCLRARLALNHKIVHGRRVEVRRAHKHKKARNTGPYSTVNSQAAALAPSILQSLQNINNLSLLSSLPQLQLQAAALTPTLLTLLQNPILAQNTLPGSLPIGYSTPYGNLPVYPGQQAGLMDALKTLTPAQAQAVYNHVQGQTINSAIINQSLLGRSPMGGQEQPSPTLTNTTSTSTYSLFGDSSVVGNGNGNEIAKTSQPFNPYMPQMNYNYHDALKQNNHPAERGGVMNEFEVSQWLNEGNRGFPQITSTVHPIGTKVNQWPQ